MEGATLKPVHRFVLGAALAVLVVAIGGVVAVVYPFLSALRIEPLEALRALFGGGG